MGNLRTALLAWLWARSAGGGFTLRVEDLDPGRCRPEVARQQLDDLAWLGLTWDEGPGANSREPDLGQRGPYWQSQRTAVYQRALETLRAQGHLYDCYCSRAEIAAASAPHGPADDGPRYPGTCRDLNSAQRAERGRTRPAAVRLRVPPGPLAFLDAVAGPQAFDVQAQVGDFVVRRADGVFAYQLAVVVDDAAMGVTQVLRGADLLSSTSRQLLLYRLLGAAEPAWAHAPLLVSAEGPDAGVRLSKREAAAGLDAMRARGLSASGVVGLLAWLSGLQSGQQPVPCSPQDLLTGFSLSLVPKHAVPLPTRLLAPQT